MYKLKHIKLINIVGSISIFSLFALALLLISPPVTDVASADTRTVDAASFGVNINSESVVSIAIDKQQEKVNVTPTTAGSFTSQDATITVQTNNLDGYKLMLTTNNGQNDRPELVNVDHNDSAIISTASTLSGSDLAKNTWGYNITSGIVASSAATEYHQITNGSIIATTEKIMEVKPEIYTLSFGAKVGSDIPAGKYSAIATVSAVANPININNLQNLTYMQDMTHEICANTLGRDGAATVTPGNEITKQLVDTRDGNVYWVAKLADQNCWMTQNLALDLDATKGLSAADSDITTDWTSKSRYPIKTTLTNSEFTLGEAKTDTYSWSMGNYVMNGAKSETPCYNPPTADSPLADAGQSLRPGQGIDACSGYVTQIDNSWTPSLKVIDINDPTVDSASKAYDAHYLIGNYYQWNTATAGTGGDLASTGSADSLIPNNAKHSICPKNWTLPTSDGDNSIITSGDRLPDSYREKFGHATFVNLFNAYGFSFPDMTGVDRSGPSSHNGYDVRAYPFHISNTGDVNPTHKSLDYFGEYGYIWSGTPNADDHNAYYAFFGATALLPNRHVTRTLGGAVRCVAR